MFTLSRGYVEIFRGFFTLSENASLDVFLSAPVAFPLRHVACRLDLDSRPFPDSLDGVRKELRRGRSFLVMLGGNVTAIHLKAVRTAAKLAKGLFVIRIFGQHELGK